MSAGDGTLRFRELREEDLALVAVWRSRAHVARWFHGSLTAEQTRAKFLPRINGTEPVHVFVVERDGVAVGYIQEFRVGDLPAVAAALQVPPDAHGVDVLIGDEHNTGHGLGTLIVRTFAERLLRDTSVERVVITPDAENGAAIRCYEKAGFERVRDVPSTFDERTNLLMERRR